MVTGFLTHRADTMPIQHGRVVNGKLTFTAWVTDQIDNFDVEMRGDTLTLFKDRVPRDTPYRLQRVNPTARPERFAVGNVRVHPNSEKGRTRRATLGIP